MAGNRITALGGGNPVLMMSTSIPTLSRVIMEILALQAVRISSEDLNFPDPTLRIRE